MCTYRKIIVIATSIALLLSLIKCNEAGPLTISMNRAFRNGREIRAPFKNPEIMVARGFGKRDVTTTGQTDRGKNDFMDSDDNGNVPVEWLAKELILNPQLSKAILHRFVDSNKDGLISVHELLDAPTFDTGSANNNNNLNEYY